MDCIYCKWPHGTLHDPKCPVRRIADLEAQLATANGVLDEIGEIMWNGNCESCEKVGIVLAKWKDGE